MFLHIMAMAGVPMTPQIVVAALIAGADESACEIEPESVDAEPGRGDVEALHG